MERDVPDPALAFRPMPTEDPHLPVENTCPLLGASRHSATPDTSAAHRRGFGDCATGARLPASAPVDGMTAQPAPATA